MRAAKKPACRWDYYLLTARGSIRYRRTRRFQRPVCEESDFSENCSVYVFFLDQFNAGEAVAQTPVLASRTGDETSRGESREAFFV